MSQLSLDDSSSQIHNIANTNINLSVDEKKDKSSMFSLETQEKYEKATSFDKMEQMDGVKKPKPESTMHKVGRFLSGILGGLLLAAGIAAATAATIASFGIAAGVVAAVGGTLGASLIAGGAGATGIGLIAASVHMRPRNPEALLPQDVQDKGTNQNDDTVLLTKMGSDETATIAKALKTKYDAEPKRIQSDSDLGRKLGVLLTSIDPETHSIDKESATPFAIKSCVKGILEQNGVTAFEASEKNFLLVRHAIDAYFGQMRGVLKDQDAAALNSPEAKQGFDAIIETAKSKRSPDSEEYQLLSIFQGALNLDKVEIAKPQQNPANMEIAGNLMSDDDLEIQNVSMQEQVKELPIRFDAQGAEDTRKAIEAIGGSKVVPFTRTVGTIGGYIQADNYKNSACALLIISFYSEVA